MNEEYFILAYYFFTDIKDPHAQVRRHKEFFKMHDIRGRIYLSEQGMNGTVSAKTKEAEAFMEWLRADYKGIEFKIDLYNDHAFAKMSVKYRKQLVALDRMVDLQKSDNHLSADEWEKALNEKDEHTLLLDVRNDYEWEVGHFEGAELPRLDTFRKFSDLAKELKEKYDSSNTKIMMYCTGGIRCELYSVLLKEEGFENVYQLDGGILKYSKEKGNKHWLGKLFVFDDRLVVPLAQEGSVISHCKHCGASSDRYYNCANMDCNELYISCYACLEPHKGCCSEECKEKPRLRAFEKTTAPKPFRKLSFSEKQKLRERA
jgi:UPF0176 protein